MQQFANPEIAQTLLTRWKDYFGAAFRQPLTQYLVRMEETLSEFADRMPDIRLETNTILTSAGSTMMNTLFTLCSRTFLDLLLRVQDTLPGDSPEARYQAFVETQLLPNQAVFYSPETELGRLVEQRIRYSVKAFREFLERFDCDRPLLREALGIAVQSIDDIQFSSGDTHNSGKTVFLIQVNGGERLLYKPHSTANDEILSRLLQWVNENARLRLPLRHARTCSRGAYGWQEFIPYKACETQTEAENYMYRLGCLLFFSFLTCCNDLHLENIIAAGEHPFLIDLETMCVNQYGFGGYSLEAATSWDLFLASSVFSSLLLPTNFSREKAANRMDVSGILAGVSGKLQSDEKFYRIINEGTDQICYTLQPMSAQDSKFHNIAVLNGQRLHAGDYLEFITEGFRDVYTFLLENKEAYRALMEDGLFDAGVYRLVLRNTSLYEKYLLASYHPAYLPDRLAVFQRLKGTGDYANPSHRKLVEMEIRQLLNDDIPYFYSKFRSLDLYGPDDCCVGFFSKSTQEQLLEKLEQLSEADLYRQLYCIRTSIARSSLVDRRFQAYPVPEAVFAASTLTEKANALADWIEGLRERFHRIDTKPQEEPAYFCIFGTLQGNSIELEPPVLYNGLGSFLFYVQYYAARWGVSAGEALARLERAGRLPSFPKADADRPTAEIGLFDGLGSSLYLYGQLYLYSGQEQYKTYVNALCDRLLSSDSAENDVISGYAGVLIAAFRLYEKLPELTKLKTLAAFCGERLYQRWEQKQLRHMTGFAHGYAGISTALMMAGKLTAKDAYFDAGMDLVRREDALYDADLGAWKIPDREGSVMNAWCYGAPGLLVARMLALRCGRASDRALLEQDLAIALELTKRELKKDLWLPILCHGLPGNLEILRWYARETGDTSLEPIVAEGDVRLLQHIQKEGLLCELSAKVLNISFMAGLSGLGYYLLEMTNPNIPSVLALELF